MSRSSNHAERLLTRFLSMNSRSFFLCPGILSRTQSGGGRFNVSRFIPSAFILNILCVGFPLIFTIVISFIASKAGGKWGEQSRRRRKRKLFVQAANLNPLRTFRRSSWLMEEVRWWTQAPKVWSYLDWSNCRCYRDLEPMVAGWVHLMDYLFRFLLWFFLAFSFLFSLRSI